VRVKYSKKDMDILADIWDHGGSKSLQCPQCKHKMVIVQVEPIHDAENAYVPYDTIIECTSCDFKIRAESFSILGSVKNFDLKNIEIASWSPSGSRVISNYEHVLDYEVLKELKETGELKEFLVVNKQVIQIIG
jgi:DNA-directed RNA polymerase subunit RPC12/RpoP